MIYGVFGVWVRFHKNVHNEERRDRLFVVTDVFIEKIDKMDSSLSQRVNHQYKSVKQASIITLNQFDDDRNGWVCQAEIKQSYPHEFSNLWTHGFTTRLATRKLYPLKPEFYSCYRAENSIFITNNIMFKQTETVVRNTYNHSKLTLAICNLT